MRTMTDTQRDLVLVTGASGFVGSAVARAARRHDDALHDRASYRYYWAVLRRARATGQPLPAESAPLFGDAGERAARGREK